MLALLDLRRHSGDLDAALLRRPAMDADRIEAERVHAVREIIAGVRAGGDEALREYTRCFDGCSIDELRVPPAQLRAALDAAPGDLRTALEYASEAIRTYHETQLGVAVALDRAGVRIREMVVPVERAGCYVPGGRASYPSTVLMTVIPARVAGVPEVVVCVPPDRDGKVARATLAAAALAGVDEVYRIGGAQAIAAMTYGTETIRPVDVVVGPGNAYVALAKREVAGDVGIDSITGPSELVVVADDTAVPELVAADLLAQAEHGPDGTAVLVTWSEALARSVDEAISKAVVVSSRRADIEATLASGGRIVVVEGPEDALAVVNVLAPEHLELITEDPDALVARVRNAGAVFCGPWAPAAVGDYVIGVNHVLPTARGARFASALRVDDFRKHVHVVTLDASALIRVGPYVRTLATAEGLDEHARSVALREHLGEARR
jgi:histidinol dehydrogenase